MSEFLLPGIDEDSAPFWEGCAAGELRVQRCAECGLRRMPPRPMCPACHSFEHVWEVTSGLGTVWSFVVAHPPLLPAYAEQAPYNVIVVALDDDPTLRLVGNLVESAGVPLGGIDPATIEIGEAVRVVFDPIDDDAEAVAASTATAEAVAMPRWVRVS